MSKFRMPQTQLLLTLAGAVICLVLHAGWLEGLKFWQKAEGALVDQRYLWRGGGEPDTNILVVGVQTGSFTLDALSPEEINASETLGLMSQPWPWDRRVHAAVLKKLVDAGAKVVVFDFVFPSAKPGDEVFAATLKEHEDRAVIGSMISEQEYKLVPPSESLTGTGAKDICGLVNLWPDSDGIARRGRYRTSLERESPKLSQFAGGVFPDNLTHISAVAAKKFSGTVVTPPYDRDNFIDFRSGQAGYEILPVEQMFVQRLWDSPRFDGGKIFRGKIVVVGPLAEIFQDVHGTPFGQMAGPEIQAEMISTLLRRASIGEPSPAMGDSIMMLMVVLALITCLRVNNALFKFFLLLAAAAIFWLCCQLAFTRWHLMVAMLPPLAGLTATGAIGVVGQFVAEQMERRRYRNVLDRYVSKNVAETILGDRRKFEDALSGQKKAVTILFSDIRSFTTISEGREPQELVAQLNEYFLEMVGAVLAEGGTLQKFIGDAIMAAWGDTHTLGADEDARRAVRTALRMREALDRLNRRWASQPGRVVLHIGIGINHGEIIAGNIGHPQRMEFTVMGDGVNLASRLESATKQFHTDLLVGATVEALTRNDFIFRRVDLLAVKGKSRPVEVFQVLGATGAPVPAWLAKYHDAVNAYRARRFPEARELFAAVQAESGAADFLCGMYQERCAGFEKTPPGETWDGSYKLSEK